MPMPRITLVLTLTLALAACQSAEERAEDHYLSALALLEEGDLARATVEFRNVFQLNGTHLDARRTYAAALRENGQLPEAYSQFLRLAEQSPDDLEARVALAQMAMETQNWAQVRLHGERALELSPADPRVAVIRVTLSYATALEEDDNSARRDAAAIAEELVASNPEDLGLRRILIDSAIRDNDLDRVLDLVEDALEIAPDNRNLHNTRLSILAERENADGIEDQLITMIDLFSEDPALTSTLLRFYLSRGEADTAEAFLRAQVEEADSDDTDMRLSLVQFISEVRGPEDGIAELDRLIEDAPDVAVYRMVRAALRFENSDADAAIAEMQGLIDDEGLSGGELNNARITLARMLMETNNAVGARRLVAEVLEADSTNVDALKMEAHWLIEDDQADDAIAMLRNALEESPNDFDAMALMARAHERNGNAQLARDFLSLAFEASNGAPAEALRYAAALSAEGLYLAAEEVLIDALRITPGNTAMMRELGRTYIQMEDWSRAEQVEESLRRMEDEGSLRLANGLQAARLAAEGRLDETVEFLSGLADTAEEGDLSAQIAVVQAMLLSGEAEEALAYVIAAAEENPGDPRLLVLRGATEGATGDLEAAEASYREVLADNDQVENVWVELVRILYAQGENAEAEIALAAGLEALPEGLNLLWAQAGFLERAGDYDGAIGIYEQLYERAPDSLVVANNLASMMTTYRADEDGLERAYAIARRLRNSEVPQFRDTYGWIAFRRGDLEEARPYLEDASAALPGDPIVQYHFGMLLAAEQRTDQAIEQFERVLELAPEDDTRPQVTAARDELERLRAEAPDSE